MNPKTSVHWSKVILFTISLVFGVYPYVQARSARLPDNLKATVELPTSSTLASTPNVTETNQDLIPTISPTGTPADHTPTTSKTSTSDITQEYVTATPSPTSATSTTIPEPTATYTQVISNTPTPSLTLTPTTTLGPDEPVQKAELDFSQIYIPFLTYQEPPPFIPPELALFCSSPDKSIPDNNQGGSSSTIQITDQRIITDLNIYLKIDHSYVGDLSASLNHKRSGKKITLFDRPGYPGNPCSKDDIRAIFDDEMTWHVETKCANYPAALSGSFEADGFLSTFDGFRIDGEWELNITDSSPNDTGTIKKWCLAAEISANPAPPTPEPPSPIYDRQKIIMGVSGKPQYYKLDCESRSAVDWANYFGKNIGELTFFQQLPHSDNPDKGFVGSVNGTWGQIPPNPYGVHAEPVAELLRDYGLPAKARRPLSWDELRAEISAGRPVIVWIIGYHDNGDRDQGPLLNGAPEYYTPSDGMHTVVARYEHTVVVTGYTSSYVYYLNGSQIYKINSDKFLDSWSALGNMAITYSP